VLPVALYVIAFVVDVCWVTHVCVPQNDDDKQKTQLRDLTDRHSSLVSCCCVLLAHVCMHARDVIACIASQSQKHASTSKQAEELSQELLAKQTALNAAQKVLVMCDVVTRDVRFDARVDVIRRCHQYDVAGGVPTE
jgi:hypothetical protein